MDNSRGWTDWDLTKIREEMGSIESIPINKSPSYENSEHKYMEHGDRPVMLGESSVPGYKSSEHYYMERGDRPVMLGQSSEPGYKSTEEYYSEGFVSGMGPNINGKKPSELIEGGFLTPSTIKEEDKKIVYEDIMLGVTRDKNMLAKKIDLIISDENIVNSILSNQYALAVDEIFKESKGFVDHSPANRKFQFLATSKILMEKGYNLENVTIGKDSPKDFIELLSDFRGKSSGTSLIDDPSWFVDGKVPEGYDLRRVNNASLFTGSLLIDMYKKNPNVFKDKYEEYVNLTNLEPVSYEQFMERYGIFPHVLNEVEESLGGMNM